MDNKKYIEEFEKNREQIKELFKELTEEEFYDAWSDTFEIERVEEKQVIITYNGTEDVKKFKKECSDILLSCVQSVMGDTMKLKIAGDSWLDKLSPKWQKNIRAAKFFGIGMAFVCLAAAIIVIMCSYIGNRNFRETFYNVSSIKVDSQLRVIQISDLHKASYGKDNKKLLTRIEELKPDIIVCTGDIVNSAKKHVEYAANLGRGLSEIAPSYYIYGNNEVESIYDFLLNQKDLDEEFGFEEGNRDEERLLKVDDPFEKELEKTGIKVLKNEKDTIEVKGMMVDVYGVLTSNPSSFWSYSGQRFADYIYEEPNNIKITAVHEPFIFQEFEPGYWGDLIVCGHTHGGVIRVPILGPLFTREGGLFPERKNEFVYGRYDAAGAPLIVSGGLENSNILRINNQPELVVIDINKF